MRLERVMNQNSKRLDGGLAFRLNNLSEQNATMKVAGDAYRLKEAERKHFEATLIKAAEGKSHAEKTVNAQATQEYLEFHQELARLESEYDFQKLRYDILDKAWQSEYLTCKIDNETIKRQGA